MKEVTRVITVEFTTIAKVDDYEPATEDDIKESEADFKETYDLDDAKIIKVQDFVREV